MADDAADPTGGELGQRPAPDRIARAVAKARIAGKLFEKHEPVKLGRYHLLEQVGSGGMGVVWGAWDPELERRVAIKLVKATGERAKERIQAEGQALAKLSHPNVVPVYDVGVVDEQVYLVMEWVRGKTLRAWAKDAAVREIVAAMRAGGEGLAAAHAAGLVHRDFKPDNAIVGDDGRVRVLDFGLATSGDSDDVAGTPRYMAPEQRDGKELTAAVDQFAFGVALRELIGEQPPRWISAIVARATAEVPADRFASMADLLRALGRDPRTIWTRRLAVAGVMGIAGGAFAAGTVRGDAAAIEPCSGAAGEIAATWNPKALGDHVRALGPYGATIADATARDLSMWSATWATAKRAACLANRANELPVASYERTLGCIARARAAFTAATSLVSAATVDRLPDVVVAARSLPAVERCRGESELSTVPPPPAPISERAGRISDEIERVRILAIASDPSAVAAAESVDRDAAALAYEPLTARASLSLGIALLSTSQRPQAIEVLDRAALAALAVGDQVVAIEAIARELFAIARTTDTTSPAALGAEATIRIVEPIAKSLGEHGAFARSLLYNNIGTLHLAREHRTRAASYFTRGLEVRPPITGATYELASLTGNLGLVTDDPVTRDALLAQATSELAVAVGRDHPRTLDAALNAAALLDDPVLARTRMSEACTRYQELHPHLVDKTAECLYEVGWLAFDAGDRAAALADFEKIAKLRIVDKNEGAFAHAYLSLARDPTEVAATMRAFAAALEAREHAWLRFRAIDALILVAYAEQAQHHVEITRTIANAALTRLATFAGYASTAVYRRREARLRTLAQ